MGFDSSANLLFTIGADASDAQSNIQRFRAVLSKDLDQIGNEFSDWSNKVLGNLTTLKGAMTAGVAALAAGAAAGIYKANQALDFFIASASEIGKASKLTNISAEDMSKLRYAARMTGTDFETLTIGVVKFNRMIAEANSGNKEAQAAFRAVGISQKDLRSGLDNSLPLLYRVADRYHETASAGLKAQSATDLFTRSGLQLINFLSRGSEKLKEYGEQARRAGILITEEDVKKAREYKVQLQQVQTIQEAIKLRAGARTAPFAQWWESVKQSLYEANTETKVSDDGFSGFVQVYLAAIGRYYKAKDDLKATIRSAQVAESGEDTGIQLKTSDEAGKTRDEYYGISGILGQIRMQLASVEGDEARIYQQAQQYRLEVEKAADEMFRRKAAGQMGAESFQREFQLWIASSKSIGEYVTQELAAINQKRSEAAAVATQQLEVKLEGLRDQSFENQRRAAEKEIALLIEEYRKKKQYVGTNVALIEQIRLASLAKIDREEREEAVKARRELETRLDGLREQSYENQRQAAEKEIALLIEEYRKKKQYVGTNVALIEQIRLASLAKIDREEREALRQQAEEYQSLLQNLRSQYNQFFTARMTSYERLRFTYEEDVRRFSWAEEQKKLAEAKSIEQMAVIVNWFGQLRQAALNQYGTGLVTLQNSQGWEGVFGDYFAQQIRGNEELLREWSESANRSTIMVRVSMETLRQSAQRTFTTFAQGMGQNIANAIVYRKSIGEAMRAAAAETISAFAAESMIAAIVASGYGFYYLARQMYTSAANAFIAAGVFASVGTAAAVAGRAIAPKESTSNSSSTASSASSSSTSTSSTSSTEETAKTRVSIVINGHVIGRTGVEELAEIINDAVINRDVRLVATQTKQRGRVSP